MVLYSTPVSRQTDKFESPKLPIYSKILRDLRVPFPFPKSEGNFWAETSGGDADAAAAVQCYAYSLISKHTSKIAHKNKAWLINSPALDEKYLKLCAF